MRKITNGIILMIIGILHTSFALSADGFGKQFREFSKSCFFNLFKDIEKLRIEAGRELFEAFSAFWFFYFGLLIFPLGLLLHSIELKYKVLPNSFTISYLIFVIIGCYMLPQSGMTLFMLPHAVYMLIRNLLKIKRVVNSGNSI